MESNRVPHGNAAWLAELGQSDQKSQNISVHILAKLIIEQKCLNIQP